MDENECVQFILDKANNFLDKDKYAVKSWLIVGKTLYPKNFNIMYELYLIEKKNENYCEIVKLLHDLYLNFSKEPILIKEINNITSSLLNNSSDNEIIQYQKIFSTLPNNMQCQLLLEMAERNYKHAVEQCRVLKLLLEKHKDYVPARLQLANIIKLNLLAEKSSDFATLSNGRCHYLVCEVLPFLLSCPQIYNINEQEFTNLLQLVFEYFVHRIYINSDHDLSIWKIFLSLINLFGTQLKWRTNEDLEKAKNIEERLSCLEESFSSLSLGSQDLFDISKQKLFYHIFALYIEALYIHMLDMRYNVITKRQSSFILEFSTNDISNFENKIKRKKLVEDEKIFICLKSHFVIAVRCWKILKSQYIIQDFENILSKFSSNHLLSIFHSLEIDIFLYEGLFKEALNSIECSIRSQGKFFSIKLMLQKACCLFKLKEYKESIEIVFQCLKSEYVVPGKISEDLKFSLMERKRILKYVNINSQDLFVFCVRIILLMLKSRIVGLGIPISDTVLGHMIVLLQYDWPMNVNMFEEIIGIIKQNHSFCYPMFIDYVINVEIIEEFSFIRNSNLMKLELCCTGAKNLNCRSMARLLNKLGTKENLKVVLEKQVTRSNEELCDLIKAFLLKEEDSIKKCCEN